MTATAYDCHRCGDFTHEGRKPDAEGITCPKCGARILPLPFRRALNRFEIWKLASEPEREQIAAYYRSFSS